MVTDCGGGPEHGGVEDGHSDGVSRGGAGNGTAILRIRCRDGDSGSGAGDGWDLHGKRTGQGTLQFTTLNAHPAGYTIGSASGGLQEAQIIAAPGVCQPTLRLRPRRGK